MKKQTRKTTVQMAIWTWAWVASMALATFGRVFLWDKSNTTLTAISIALNVALGIGMLIGNRNHFNNFDELEKKIYLEALALAMGLNVVFGLAFNLCEQAGLLPFKADIGVLVLFTSLSFSVILILNKRRYS
jgi:hypothetical protein